MEVGTTSSMPEKFPWLLGSIVAMDRGYNDFKLFANWTENGTYLVIRLKYNADLVIIAEQRVPKNRNILADQSLLFEGNKAQKNCPHVYDGISFAYRNLLRSLS